MSGIGQPATTNYDAGDGEGISDAELQAWSELEDGEGGEQQGAGDDPDNDDDQGTADRDIGDDDDQAGQQESTADDEPPEFWAADRKALWDKIADPEVRAAIKGHVEEVSKGTARKLEESAAKVRTAEESAKGALDNQTQLAAWWQANGQKIQIAMLGKWAGVDWNKLANDDPAGFVKARQQFETDQAFVRDITMRHHAEVKRVEDRRKAAHQTERAAEHDKLAKELPDEFGTLEKAQKTYDALSDYLLKQGIAPDRLSGVYEAPIVKIVRKAYRYDQLQARAKGITTPKPPGQSASTTPKRLVPGPGIRAGNRQNEAGRQAFQRLESGQRLSSADAEELFG
jgi:hypothetical protein